MSRDRQSQCENSETASRIHKRWWPRLQLRAICGRDGEFSHRLLRSRLAKAFRTATVREWQRSAGNTVGCPAFFIHLDGPQAHGDSLKVATLPAGQPGFADRIKSKRNSTRAIQSRKTFESNLSCIS